jgi:hypothetical protein
MSLDPINAWLAEFGRSLPLRGRRRRRVIAELEAHLMDAADAARGSGDEDPSARAVARVGDPTVVAAGFRRPGSRLVRFVVVLWLPAAVAATVCLATVYAVGQNILRSGANDPQIQLAQDDAARLSTGTSAGAVTGDAVVDLATSLGLSVSVVDADGAVVSSTARLDGATAVPPVGALRAATAHGQNTVTWQPRPGVRQAAVIVAYDGAAGSGTVVVARSLRLAEQREDTLLQLTALGWILALLAAAGVAVLAARRWPYDGPYDGPRDLPPPALVIR